MDNSFYLSSGLFGRKWCDYVEQWKFIHEKFGEREYKNLLNIGIGSRLECSKWNQFLNNILKPKTISNLEIDEETCEFALKAEDEMLSNITCGDVREIRELFMPKSFDVLFWSHGPEHILRDEWKDTFEQLELITTKLILLQCPWGSGYDYTEGHVSKSIRKGEFEAFGYTVMYNGRENTKDAGILAYKELV